MEQRPLRLGDILDDYCPRERRVTNHAIVAMIGDDVKQTRCTTCDSEHAYKGGREPRRRKKDAPAALYREVLAGMQEPDVPAAAAAEDAASPALVPAVAVPPSIPEPTEVVAETSPIAEQPALTDAEHADSGHDVQPVEEGPVHRRLIRATLPRPDGAAKETRPIPEFTMRHNGRNGQFRGGQFRAAGNGNGNGHRPPGRRFAGGGSNSQSNRGGQGRGGGFRGGPHPQRSGGGGKKRSR
jgi:hypothetical protein